MSIFSFSGDRGVCEKGEFFDILFISRWSLLVTGVCVGNNLNMGCEFIINSL